MAKHDDPNGPSGLLLIDKGQGWTSHDVVAKTRRLLGLRRIGHTGTLDPMATGLLVLAVGRATRLVEYLSAHDKVYAGEIALGARTDTDDAEGTIIETRPVPAIDGSLLRELEGTFTGNLQQRPPAYSAVQVEGQRAYAAARRGNPFDLPARAVTVREFSLRDMGANRLEAYVRCGPGTYIRSLARDIGDTLGCGGHLATLRRLQVGAFSVADAWTLASLELALASTTMAELLLPADDGLGDLPVAILTEEHGKALAQGKTLEIEAASDMAPLRLYDERGTFVGIGASSGSQLRPLKVLAMTEMR